MQENNFEKISEKFTDPSLVRNFLRDALNDAQRKQYSLFFHVVYALICSVMVFLAADGTILPIVNFLFLFAAPTMCVFTFLYSPIPLKAIPVALPLVFLLIKIAASGFKGDFFSVCQTLFVYILCIVGAAVIAKAVISGYTKNTLFVCLSVVFGVICFCQIIFAFIAAYGTFSFPLLLDTINQFFDNVVNQGIALSQTPEGLEMFRSLAISGTELSDAQITELVKQSMELSTATIKPLLVSFFVLSCMLYGFVSVWVFSIIADHFNINVFVCIMDENWTYRPSLVSTIVYDILFFVLIISAFTNIPQNISFTVMNLMLVLTPLMYISGIRGIYTMLQRKVNNKAHSIIFTLLIAVAATMIIGGLAFLIIGSVGVTFITARNREERILVPVKYASDLAVLHEMSEENNKEKENTENQSSNNQDTL